MKYYITSDTHFNHAMLVEHKYREANFEEKILENLKHVSGDVLLHLGDFAIGKDAYYHERFMLATKNFRRKILVRGNHDSKSYSWYYSHGWDFVCEVMRLRYKEKEILFSHMPILGESSEFSSYLKVDKNIHGHLHGRGKYSHRKVDGYDIGFHYDVAPDIHNLKPVDLDKIII